MLRTSQIGDMTAISLHLRLPPQAGSRPVPWRFLQPCKATQRKPGKDNSPPAAAVKAARIATKRQSARSAESVPFSHLCPLIFPLRHSHPGPGSHILTFVQGLRFFCRGVRRCSQNALA